VVLDLVAVTLFQLITSVSNCLSDREEDAIDYPERTRLCQSLGYGFMRDAVIASTAAYLAVLGVMTWVVDVPLDTIIIAFLGLLASFSYSFLRLKRHPLGAPSLLGPMSGLSLWVGWQRLGRRLRLSRRRSSRRHHGIGSRSAAHRRYGGGSSLGHRSRAARSDPVRLEGRSEPRR
jgi:hypothetical protein